MWYVISVINLDSCLQCRPLFDVHSSCSDNNPKYDKFPMTWLRWQELYVEEKSEILDWRQVIVQIVIGCLQLNGSRPCLGLLNSRSRREKTVRKIALPRPPCPNRVPTELLQQGLLILMRLVRQERVERLWESRIWYILRQWPITCYSWRQNRRVF